MANRNRNVFVTKVTANKFVTNLLVNFSLTICKLLTNRALCAFAEHWFEFYDHVEKNILSNSICFPAVSYSHSGWCLKVIHHQGIVKHNLELPITDMNYECRPLKKNVVHIFTVHNESATAG